MTKKDDGYTIKREDFMIRKEDMIYLRCMKSIIIIIIIIFSIINIYCLYLLFFSFSSFSSSYNWSQIIIYQSSSPSPSTSI